MALEPRAAPNFNSSRLKLGLFSSNCSSGIAVTKVPERRDASWESNAVGLHWSLPTTKGDWYAAQAGLQLLLELTNQ